MPPESIDFRDGAEWDEFVGASPQGSVFCATPFLEATSTRYETVAVGERGVPEAAALVVLDGDQPVRAPAPYTVYQGVLLSADVSALPSHRRIRRSLELVSALIEACAARYPRVSFCLHPSFDDVRAFSWFNYGQPELGRFEIEVQYTAMLDLRGLGGLDELLALARKVRRQEYQQAVRAGFVVEETREVDRLLELYRATFARQSLEVAEADAARVAAIARGAIERGFGTLFACRSSEGELASMALFLHDARAAYYLFGANDPEFRKAGASTLLLFEAMWRLRGSGGRADVVGVNSPQRGDYKTSLGAELAPYFLVTLDRPVPH